jgi:hypothetical protein
MRLYKALVWLSLICIAPMSNGDETETSKLLDAAVRTCEKAQATGVAVFWRQHGVAFSIKGEPQESFVDRFWVKQNDAQLSSRIFEATAKSMESDDEHQTLHQEAYAEVGDRSFWGVSVNPGQISITDLTDRMIDEDFVAYVIRLRKQNEMNLFALPFLYWPDMKRSSFGTVTTMSQRRTFVESKWKGDVLTTFWKTEWNDPKKTPFTEQIILKKFGKDIYLPVQAALYWLYDGRPALTYKTRTEWTNISDSNKNPVFVPNSIVLESFQKDGRRGRAEFILEWKVLGKEELLNKENVLGFGAPGPLQSLYSELLLKLEERSAVLARNKKK